MRPGLRPLHASGFDLDHGRTSIQSSVLPPRLRAVDPRVVTVAPDMVDRSPRLLRLVPDSPSRCGELLGELVAEEDEEELSWLAMLPLKGPLFCDSDSLAVEGASVSGRFTTNTCFAPTRPSHTYISPQAAQSPAGTCANSFCFNAATNVECKVARGVLPVTRTALRPARRLLLPSLPTCRCPGSRR